MEQLWAVIEHGTVVAVIVADQLFVDAYYSGSIRVDQLRPRPGIGWKYQDGTFAEPESV
jgi:hypothetical protein